MRNIKKSIIAGAISSALALSSASVMAANDNGSLKGLIVDGKQVAVAGAVITAKDSKTGFTRTVTVKADGSYRFSALPVGSYTVTIAKDGFETFKQDNVRIQIGTTSLDAPIFRVGTDTEIIEVRGSSVAVIDVSSSESALNIGDVELARLPIARDLTSVALLAPGTSKGDNRFGNLASFGGASVAENAYFINGLNVTDFRNGLGGSTIPFEFYKEFQVKTGGYSAEFGRSTGGVINAVTKSGTNEWEFAANVYYTPESMGEQSPNILKRNGSMENYNAADSYNKMDANISVGGPIIEDTLFFYVLYNPREITSEWASSGGSTFNEDNTDDAFWGGKIDWHISDDHLLEVTGFSDARTTVNSRWDYDRQTGTKSGKTFGTSKRGGDNISVKYTGYITDDFVISALWGENKADLTDKSSFDDYPVVYDNREGNWTPLGNWANFNVTTANDSREALRLDGEYALEDHVIRFGWDSETNTSFDETNLSGGTYWALFSYDAGDRIGSIDYTFAEDTFVARQRTYATGGEFETLSNAFYVEDTWTITDDITATIGVRSESFNNKNAEGKSFIKIDNQIAPRLGISWDVNGDGESKVFANYGRYHLPVAANTNIRMAGAETYIHDYYEFGGTLGANDVPTTGALLGTQVNGTGEVPDVSEVLDTSIDPMYQDEIIIGYQTMLDDDWSFGVKYTQRDLKSIIDDITIDKAIRANNWDGPHGNVYLLTNPNTDIVTSYDTDGDGTLEEVTIAAADLGYPDPKRMYHALEFSLEKAWDDVWSLNANYTWSHSYGNAEGYVKSDNGQDDAGLTTDWDFPYLMDGANGNLPNDRRHTFKVFGSYAITENLLMGANFLMQSGRPQNGFGHGLPTWYGDENDQYEYGQTYFVGAQNENFVPRGSFGRTPWIFNLDLSLKYNMDFEGTDVSFQVDVFNVLNAQSVIRVDEEQNDGSVNEEFLMPVSFQTPRYAMFSASVRF
ncbi:MAG: TonB-dependent receptor [Colwelliaceae bacterium]|nr:TonB-dependent receptor [Colwelliaceae bacterium]